MKNMQFEAELIIFMVRRIPNVRHGKVENEIIIVCGWPIVLVI